VTGESNGGTSPTALNGRDYATVAYDPADGTELWVARYDGPGGNYDAPRALGLSPDRSRVFVTGGSAAADDLEVTVRDYATVAHDAADGSELWVARYDGAIGGVDVADAIAVGPDGARVFVTGLSGGEDTGSDYATVAYDAALGSELWTARHNGTGNGNDSADGLAVSPNGSRIFVTGPSADADTSHDDFATVAWPI